MAHLIIEKPFDYRWPSGSLTAYRATDGKPLVVKAEVAEYAVAKGYGTIPPAAIKAASPSPAPQPEAFSDNAPPEKA